MNKFKHIQIATLMFAAIAASNVAISCSRVFYADKTPAVMVGRNMDWSTDLSNLMQTNLIVYPRGIERDGLIAENPIHWKAKFGSLVASAYFDKVATDGINEQGLAAHMLWYAPADYGQRDVKRPGLSVIMAIQFFLDNFATVNEATQYIQKTNMQIVPFVIPIVDKSTPQHFILDDATGDSAIIEYDGGKPVIYHDSKYAVATNEPSYQQQLDNAAQYIGLGGDKPLPGGTEPSDRFVRGSYYMSRLPQPSSIRAEVSEIFSVLNAVSEPFELHSDESPNPVPTLWQVVADLSNKIYYYHDMANGNMLWVDFNKFDIKEGAPVMKLSLQKGDELFGNATSKFKKVS